MAEINVNGANLGNALQTLLMCDDLMPGDDVSYQTAKNIYLWHPLGARMAESPIKMAQSQEREIAIPGTPEEMLRDAFLEQWEKDDADGHIANLYKTARIYGIASLGMLAEGVPSNDPIDPFDLPYLEIGFNLFDPLNTAGSLVLNQNPNDIDFQKYSGIAVSGVPYHRSRTITHLNEKPIYISYTNSAFGFVGRSVYQRALFPLKSYINALVTDDMVTRKAGVMIAKLKAPGSIIDNIMATMAGVKRQLLKEAQTNNVISVDVEEAIETLNMQNIDGAYGQARRNIIENIATAADMPAQLLTQDSLSAEFHEGTEDAKRIAGYIEGVRKEMKPGYSYFDRIIQHRAWNEDFYKTVQDKYPEQYGDMSYKRAFLQWSNAFRVTWPSLITEPESEAIKVEEQKFKAVLGAAEVMLPMVDPENATRTMMWMQDCFNEAKGLFPHPLDLDFDALREHLDQRTSQAQQSGQEMLEGPDGEEPHKHAPYADSSEVLSIAHLPRRNR